MPVGPVLIDVNETTDITLTKEFLDRLGHQVIVCHGPPHATLCPLLEEGSCDLAEQAHGVIFEFDLDRAQHRAILQRYREILDEDIPIHVVVPTGQEQKHAQLLHGIHVHVDHINIAQLDGFAAEVEAYERIVM